MRDCVFCQILAGEVEASIVYRDERVTAFMDIQPLTPGHLLVIPNQHASSLKSVEPDTMSRMAVIGQMLGLALLESSLAPQAFNLFLANGELAGQTVFHSHLHVIPRYPDDGFGVRFPPGFGRIAERGELDEQAEVVRAALPPEHV